MPALDPAYEPIREVLAARLRYLMDLRGINQRVFARYMGVSYQMVQVWLETGSYRCDVLPRMAQILDCSIQAFFDTNLSGHPTRRASAVDRLILDAARPLTQVQRDALIQFLRTMTAVEETESPSTESERWTASTMDMRD